MNTRLSLLVGGSALVALLTGLTFLPAQRPAAPTTGVPGTPGRFAVARIQGEDIILLDTATGELYRAAPPDIKKFTERPETPPAAPRPLREKEKDRDGSLPPRDRDKGDERPSRDKN